MMQITVIWNNKKWLLLGLALIALAYFGAQSAQAAAPLPESVASEAASLSAASASGDGWTVAVNFVRWSNDKKGNLFKHYKYTVTGRATLEGKNRVIVPVVCGGNLTISGLASTVYVTHNCHGQLVSFTLQHWYKDPVVKDVSVLN